MWMARYLMLRLTEKYGVDIEFHCKPLGDTDWNGSGMHCNFSTAYMREIGGKEYFEKLMAAFSATRDDHIAVYGPDNHMRLTGKHETAAIHEFTFGVANRGASIRVPHQLREQWLQGLSRGSPSGTRKGTPTRSPRKSSKTIASVPTEAKAAGGSLEPRLRPDATLRHGARPLRSGFFMDIRPRRWEHFPTTQDQIVIASSAPSSAGARRRAAEGGSGAAIAVGVAGLPVKRISRHCRFGSERTDVRRSFLQPRRKTNSPGSALECRPFCEMEFRGRSGGGK